MHRSPSVWIEVGATLSNSISIFVENGGRDRERTDPQELTKAVRETTEFRVFRAPLHHANGVFSPFRLENRTAKRQSIAGGQGCYLISFLVLEGGCECVLTLLASRSDSGAESEGLIHSRTWGGARACSRQVPAAEISTDPSSGDARALVIEESLI